MRSIALQHWHRDVCAGQLGHGQVWGDAEPRQINHLTDVTRISAGLRHSLALRSVPGPAALTEVFGWGHNSFGELGLGDTHIRLQPSLLRVAADLCVLGVACGARHSVLVARHLPRRVREDKALGPLVAVLRRDPANESLRAALRREVRAEGLDPALLDRPDDAVPGQTGASLAALPNDFFERGLRYCLDTAGDPADWRRKVYETCFEASSLGLRSLCLACARLCKARVKLRAYVRRRQRGDVCDCSGRGACECRYTVARAAFDKVCGEDRCVGPRQLRALLQSLRAPLLVEGADMEVCLLALAQGAAEDEDRPRIRPRAFEEWFEQHFDA